MADKLKFALALLMVAAGVWGFYALSQDAMIFRVLAVLAGVIVGVLIAWTTTQGKEFFEFAQDSWTETKKVVWPSRKETVQTTAVVFGFVLVMAIFLWVTDKSLEWAFYDLILGWRR